MNSIVTAGRRQVVYLGNTGPNNAREWVVVQYRNGPNGDGERIARVSVRQGVVPSPDQPVQWTDNKYLCQYLRNVRHQLSRPGVILMNKLSRKVGAATKTRVVAGSWQDKAKAELEAELGGIETEMTDRTTMKDAFTLEIDHGRADNGESEWLVFKNAKAAERYAIEEVADRLANEPELFDQKWLKRHVYVSPTDIRLISNEDADAYVDGIKDEEERLLDEAGLLQKWQSLEDKKDAASDKMMEEMDVKKQNTYQKQIDTMTAQQEKLVEKAEQKLRLELAKRTADALKNDPLAWAEDLGYTFGDDRPSWLQIDVKKAAKDAVNTDGVAHFLDSYDGEEVELDSGAVAFGTN